MLEDEEEFSWDEEKDELDDEYDRIQSVSRERFKSLDEKIFETQRLLEIQIEEMNIARGLVGFFFFCFINEVFESVMKSRRLYVFLSSCNMLLNS